MLFCLFCRNRKIWRKNNITCSINQELDQDKNKGNRRARTTQLAPQNRGPSGSLRPPFYSLLSLLFSLSGEWPGSFKADRLPPSLIPACFHLKVRMLSTRSRPSVFFFPDASTTQQKRQHRTRIECGDFVCYKLYP